MRKYKIKSKFDIFHSPTHARATGSSAALAPYDIFLIKPNSDRADAS